MRISASPHHEHLRSLPLFGAASPRELDRIAGLTTSLQIDAGRVLCAEGAVGREFFVVESGEAAVSVDGKPVTVLGPGSFFGEIALLGHELRTATVTALRPMTVLVLTPGEFHELVELSPTVRQQLEAARDARKTETAQVRTATAA